MKRLGALFLLLTVAVTGCAVEVGLRARWDPRGTMCSGWLRGSGELGAIQLSGNANLDLLMLSVESLSGSARRPWAWGEAMISAGWAPTRGLSGAASISFDARRELGMLDVRGDLEGRLHWSPARWSPYAAGSLSARLPWAWGWAELRGQGSFPWTGVRAELELGVDGQTRLTALLSATEAGPSSASVEFAASRGTWRLAALIASPPMRQTATVAWQGERGSVQGRVVVRSGAVPSWDLRSSLRMGVFSASTGVGGEAGGVSSAWIELRFAVR